MAQITTGLRAVLNDPRIYTLSQWLVGSTRLRDALVREYIRPHQGMRILDLGCGPGDFVLHLPGVDYVGIDLSEAYIREATQRFGDRATFHAGRADEAAWLAEQRFDVVVAVGVLHHLDDGEAASLLAVARRAARGGGRFVSVDPCFAPGQSAIARVLASRDRGRNVRTEAGYRGLAEGQFASVRSSVRHDLYRIPYTHCVLDCAEAVEG